MIHTAASRIAPASIGVVLAACAGIAPVTGPDTILIRNDAHSPLTVEASPAGGQMEMAACSTVVLNLDQPGWRLAIDGGQAFSHEELVASGIDRSDRWVRIDVTSNDLVADVRVGDPPEPAIIEACADD